jgi:hypothetical protein
MEFTLVDAIMTLKCMGLRPSKRLGIWVFIRVETPETRAPISPHEWDL